MKYYADVSISLVEHEPLILLGRGPLVPELLYELYEGDVDDPDDHEVSMDRSEVLPLFYRETTGEGEVECYGNAAHCSSFVLFLYICQNPRHGPDI